MIERIAGWCAIAAVLSLAGCEEIRSASPAEKAAGYALFVAADGNDAWSGRLAAPNADKTDGPFATLERARDAVRALKLEDRKAQTPSPQSAIQNPKSKIENGITVFVRAGAYELAKTFKLTQEDSGTQTAPVVYRAYPKEKVVLIGGKRITGFVPHQGAILKADVGAQGFKGIYFRQLFFNGKRQVLARYPNFDPALPYTGGYAYVDGKPPSMYGDLPNESLRVILCKEKDVRTWAHPERGEVIIFPRYNWHNWCIPIASVDRAKRTITLTKDAFKGIRPLDRYYVRNLPEELDAPGEWYLDKETWTLYFQPPGPIENAVVYAPTTENLIEIGPNAAWITIRGFTLECCDANAILVSKSENCLVASNTIHNTGGRLGYTTGVTVEGGKRCGVVGNDIFDVCNGGLRLNGGDVNTLAPAEHYAENNYIHHIGVLNGHGCGIWLSGVGLRVSHNLIHDITRCGVFGGGPDCVVEYNHIRHVNLETEDTGGYYNGGNWHIRGQVVRYNYVHDVLGYGRKKDKWVSPYFAWGIYLDDDQSGTHIYGNIVARAYLGGAHVHAGRENILENNIFVECVTAQTMFSGHDPKSEVVAGHLEQFKKFQHNPAYAKYPEVANADLNTVWHMAGNKFLRNIIYYHDPKAKLYQYSYAADDVPEQNEFDYNLIWHFGLPLEVGLKGLSPDTSWEEWRKRGFDAHSVVADPLFVDPDKDDYRLKPASPAFQLGFQPIPVEKIGPYEDPLRASWPIVEAEGVREKPIPAETPADLPPEPVRLRPEVKVPKASAAPVTDGEAGPGEWPQAPLALKERPDGTSVSTPPCQARLAHDGANLYVTIAVPIGDKAKMRLGQAWGDADAAEVCFCDASGPKPGPIFVIHGFAAGKHESVTEAGAPQAAAQQLGAAVKFAAKVADKQWVGEWAIPLSSVGISYRPGLKLGLNLGVRRTETGEWIQWFGSGSTWNLPEAGFAILE